MKLFYSAKSAGLALSISDGAFRKSADRAGVIPMEIGRVHIWLWDQLDKVKAYRRLSRQGQGHGPQSRRSKLKGNK